MTSVFLQKYASIYDLIYSDKDYRKEANWIEREFIKFSHSNPKSILELGCGTGNYTQIFARKGYEIMGLDNSDYMLRVAKKKLSSGKYKITYQKKNITDFHLHRKFDICFMLFNVLGYLKNNSEILDCFKCVREHLVTGGLFLFDFWYAPAVLSIRPTKKIKIITSKEFTVLRFAFPELMTHTIKIDMNIYKIFKDEILDEFSETHTVRFFNLKELQSLLKKNGFEILEAVPFLDSGSVLNKDTWNAFIVAKGVK